MKIAHFTLGRCNPESANGIDKTVFHLSTRQAAAGHDVRIVSLTEKPALPVPGVRVQTYAPPLTGPGWLPHPMRDLLFDRSAFNLPRRLVGDLRSDPPDVVHFHHTQVPQAVRISRALRRAGVSYCVSLHGALVERARRRRAVLKMLYRAIAERRYLNEAAFLHAVSEPDAEGARAVGVRAAIEVIPNGIDPTRIRRTDAPALSERFPRLAGLRVLLFIGRLDPQQKGLDVLVSALAESDQLGLVLVGPSFRGSRERLGELARQAGVDGRIEFPGPVFGAEKLDLLSGADAFVHPSRWEGLPFSVLEAAACGIPCLISAASDPTGLLREGGAAIETEAQHESLVAALAAVASMSGDELEAMGRRAREVVTRHFDWDTISQRVIGAYEEHCHIR